MAQWAAPSLAEAVWPSAEEPDSRPNKSVACSFGLLQGLPEQPSLLCGLLQVHNHPQKAASGKKKVAS